MKLIDLNSLNIPTEAAPQVEAAYAAANPGDIIINTDTLRMEWLKKLVQDPIFQTFQVVCDEVGFIFWSRLPLVVEVISFAGKKMTKGVRTDDDNTWVIKNVTGARTKTQIKNWSDRDIKKQLDMRKTWGNVTPVATDVGDPHGTYTLVTEDTMQGILDTLCTAVVDGSTLGWDTETEDTGEDDTGAPNPYTASIVGFSASVHDDTAYYFPINHRKPDTDEPVSGNLRKDLCLRAITRLLDATPIGDSITHNGKYDFSVCAAPSQGMDLAWIYERLNETQDTMLLANSCSEPASGLKPLAEAELDATVIDFKKLTGGRSFAYVDLKAATVYAGQDADWTRQLYPILLARAQKLGVEHIYREIELPIIEYFMRTERWGMKVDQKVFDKKAEAYSISVVQLERLFITMAINLGLTVPDGFNIGAGGQVAKLFFDPKPEGLGLPVRMRNKDNTPKTDKKHFNKLIAEGINPPLYQVLKKWREMNGLEVRYIKPINGFIQEDSRVRTSFHQYQASTGRTSSTDPSSQVLPEIIREAFVPEIVTDPMGRPQPKQSGEYATLDYSQIELRVMAVTSGEPKMLEAFRQWKDIHASTQKDVGLQDRRQAKGFNFGVGFGAGPPALSEATGITLAAAKRFYDQYWETYTVLWEHMFNNLIPYTRENLESRTWLNRVRIMQKPENSFQESELDRVAMNMPIQGGATDIMKIAIARLLPLIRDMEKIGIHPFNMVHDELDFEAEPHVARDVFRAMMSKVRRIMEQANPWPDIIPMPVDVTFGQNWAECK